MKDNKTQIMRINEEIREGFILTGLVMLTSEQQKTRFQSVC